MSDIVQVDDNNFATEVLGSELPVLVDFGATWCGPCQRQLPILEKFATDNVGKFKVCKIDVDDAQTISKKFSIRGVPTLMLFKDGQSLGSRTGLTNSTDLNLFVSSKITV